MNKGIVLKINSHSVIVLTPDGEYLKCKRLLSSYTIGEEIQFPNYAVIVNNKVKKFIPKLVPVMIASALILMSFVLLDFNKKRVLAAGYVNIESKAKVSLILDKHLKVIALKAKNDQGEKIIAELKDWEKESVKDVAEKLMVELEENEIIQHDEKVTISGSMDKKFSNEQKKLRKEIDHIKQGNTHFENEQPIKEKQKHKDTNKKDKKNGVNSQPSNQQKKIKNETKNDSKIVLKQANHSGNTNKEKQNNSKPGNGFNSHHHGNKQQENKHNHDNKKNDASKKNKNNDASKKNKSNENRGYQLGKGNHQSKNRKHDYQNHHKDSYNYHNHGNNKGHDRERNKDRDNCKRKR